MISVSEDRRNKADNFLINIKKKSISYCGIGSNNIKLIKLIFLLGRDMVC